MIQLFLFLNLLGKTDFSYGKALPAEYRLCPTVTFSEPLPFKLTEDELAMVCGSSEKAWASIPPSQAKLHLTAILQIRGYHKAVYTNRQGVLFVTLGSPTLITKISLMGAPESLDVNRKRGIRSEKLTPQKLDELQDWLILELRHLGYPCPEVQIKSNFLTGEVLATIQPGYRSKIISISSDDVGDLHPGVVRRYDAFHQGEYFDIWDVTLTERRALDDDLIIGTHFSEKCTADGVSLHQSIQPGLPRLFQVGVGMDTEQGPLFRMSSHYSRMTHRGSSIDNSLSASFRIQEFDSTFNWYFLRNPSRFYFKPTIQAKRDNEPNYVYVETRFGFLPSVSWDDDRLRWDLSIGPSYQTDQTVSGIGPGFSKNLFLTETLLMTNHAFEYFKDNPQSGYKIRFDSLFSNAAVISTLTATKTSLSAEGLMNVGNFTPPTIVLGLRTSLGTTSTANGSSDLASLPPDFRFFLGGIEDLRGFSRQELPDNGGLGAMTQAFAGLEARFLTLLPWDLQPFVFTDGGVLGSQSGTFEWPLYWSPGLGIRWASPIGSIRVVGAYGFLAGPQIPINSSAHSHSQFYLSYGEEF